MFETSLIWINHNVKQREKDQTGLKNLAKDKIEP